MDDPTLFAAVPAGDGTDTVVIRVDSKTALQLAAAWDYVHLQVELNALDHPRWLWDVAALDRAAADARVLADAAAECAPVSLTEKGRARLRLVELSEGVKTS